MTKHHRLVTALGKEYRWFALAVLVAGCTTSSGVLTLGPDTYSATAAASPSSGGAPWAQQMALNEADQHCASIGREILVINISTGTTNVSYGPVPASVTFKCLLRGDPELTRPDDQRR